ncbi:MAG: polymorphic toxin-type HINT domain-containing protein, partial [Acidobacteriota bacterium]
LRGSHQSPNARPLGSRSYADLELFTDDARERSNKFLKGEINGAVNAAKGTANAILHPIETAKGIKAGVEYLYENWDDIDLMESASNAVTKYVNASPEEQGEMVGAMLFEFATGSAVAKGATKLKALSKLDNVDAPKASPKKAFDGPDAGDVDTKQPGLRSAFDCDCFAAHTVVQTEAGPVAVEDIRIGDQVWVVDDETGERVLDEVVRLFQREASETYLLTVAGQTLETTAEHPFFVLGRGWVFAARLVIGDVLVTLDSRHVELESVEVVRGPTTVYNFEVSGRHTYFVGLLGVLTHNMCDITDIPERLLTADGQPIPFGFKNADQYSQFARKLQKGLPEDSQPLFQGSSVTGRKHTTGEVFDVGRVSDYDIGISSPSLFEKAKALGLRVKTDPGRIGPLNDDVLDSLGLKELRDTLSSDAGRKVEFLLFPDVGSAMRRPSIYVSPPQ